MAKSGNTASTGARSVDAACRKRSFLELPVPIDTERLTAEFESIPATAWGDSHWDVHCSIDVILLRGGTKGEADDFVTSEVADSPLLGDLQYISSLIAEDGPFGGAVYAFIFRMKANGMTLVHEDDNPAWKRPVRVHVPIVTNPDALLLSDCRAQHFASGGAWTFDNQTCHSVVNGDETRVHLIFDVNPNAALAELMETATFLPGTLDLENWVRTGGRPSGGEAPPLPIASGRALSDDEKLELGLDPEGMATRVVRLGRQAKLLRTPLQAGDIITGVNGTERTLMGTTALDHLRMQHEPGETVSLDLIRDGQKTTASLTLKPDYYFSPAARSSAVLGRLGFKAKKKQDAGGY